MKKFKLALAVILPVFIALLVALFVCSLNVKNVENDLGEAFAAIFRVLINIGSIFVCLPFAAAFAVLEICLFAAKKQTRVARALLIFMTILLPFLAVIVGIDAMFFASYSALFLTVAIATAAVYVAAYILCILYFINCRRSSAEASQCNSTN